MLIDLLTYFFAFLPNCKRGVTVHDMIVLVLESGLLVPLKSFGIELLTVSAAPLEII